MSGIGIPPLLNLASSSNRKLAHTAAHRQYGTDVGRFLADVDLADRKMIVALVHRYICKRAIGILSMTFGCSPFSALGKTGGAKWAMWTNTSI
ncbi:hypothetical protein [Mesorhizobium sp. M0768]|uniref:hypothetical protein n=1 Tax=Mesorhizobium sp. M0768 TaxID=2956996 RepID=UPI0033354F59